MDPLSRLPIECLQHILEILNTEHTTATFTLASLLTVNKHIASVTLPIMYRDPFRTAFYSFIDGRQRNRHLLSSTQEKRHHELLTHMLLDRLPTAERCRLPKALILTLAATTDICPNNKNSSDYSNNIDTSPLLSTTCSPSSSPSSSFDYLAQIRHFNTIAKTINGLITLPHWTATGFPESLSPDLIAYLYSDEFDRIYHSTPFRPEIVAHQIGPSKEALLYLYYHIVLDQEAVWCLASPILEQLQSFTIPYMSSIKSYIEVVGRFKSLESIRFMMDEQLEGPLTSNDYHHHQNHHHQNHGNNSNTKVATETLTHNGQVIKDMFRFVQEHVRLFPGRLRNVLCLEEVWWAGGSQRPDICNQIRQDLYRFLPPLHKPTRLGKDNWDQLMAHTQSTDLTHVRYVDGRLLADEWYVKGLTHNDGDSDKGQPLLQGLRELKDLDLGILYEGAFKWAVQEKKDMVNSKALVQLKRINIMGSKADGTDDLDDIVFAFSQTLTSISVMGLRLPEPLILGQRWVDLPALTNLKLIVCPGRIELDPQIFVCLPNLVSIQLADDTMEYRCQAIVPCPPPPATHLTKLECLWLEGWASVTFDPSTLSSVSSTLKRMIISAHRIGIDEHAYDSDYTFIPPVNELYRSYGIEMGPEEEVEAEVAAMDPIQPAVGMIRPRWTWDWDLPLLTHLVLTSEFALLFEFQMLSRCPSLQLLYLDICSNRAYGNNKPLPPQKTLALPQSERICLPSLTHLELHGGWTMDDVDNNDGENCLVRQLFSAEAGAFPNIKKLRMNMWILSTLEIIINFFRATTTTVTSSNSSCSVSRNQPAIHLQIADPTRKEQRTLRIYECETYDTVYKYHDRDREDDGEKKDTATSDILITSSFSTHIYYKLRPDYYKDSSDDEDDMLAVWNWGEG